MSDIVTIRGFAATRPELRALPSGVPVASFRVASTPRWFDAASGTWQQGRTNWYTVTAFRRLAKNIAASIDKGHPVLLTAGCRSNSSPIKTAAAVPPLKSTRSRLGWIWDMAHAYSNAVWNGGILHHRIRMSSIPNTPSPLRGTVLCGCTLKPHLKPRVTAPPAITRHTITTGCTVTMMGPSNMQIRGPVLLQPAPILRHRLPRRGRNC